jgi:hypothetical protein
MSPERKWHYCDTCRLVAIQCEKCGNTSCNGGGCDDCFNDFEEASQMIRSGVAPKKDGLPVRSRKWAFDALLMASTICAETHSDHLMDEVLDRIFATFADVAPTHADIVAVISSVKAAQITQEEKRSDSNIEA